MSVTGLAGSVHEFEGHLAVTKLTQRGAKQRAMLYQGSPKLGFDHV